MTNSAFLQRYAHTQRFRLGIPQHIRVSPDGRRVVFTRSADGTDTTRSLWSLDVATGAETMLLDPRELGTDESLPEEVRRLQERSRDFGAGVTGYATDAELRMAALGLAGRLWSVDLLSGAAAELPATGPVIDPRPSPSGEHIAYVSSGALRVIGRDGTGDRALATPEADDVTFGLAEYVAAEDMHRTRGFWWSPDGDRLLVAKVDNREVSTWYLANPGDPAAEPSGIRYPVAGTANATVTLSILGLDGSAVDAAWDEVSHEYLIAAHWSRAGVLIAVQSRDHKSLLLQRLDPGTGAVETVREERDHAWVLPIPGAPGYTGNGDLVWAADVDGDYRLLVNGEAVTRDGLQVREIDDIDGDTVVFSASEEPTEIQLWTWTRTNGCARVTDEPGVVYSAAAGGGTIVAGTATLDRDLTVSVLRDGAVLPIASAAEEAALVPRVTLLRSGEEELRTAVLFPTGHEPGSRRLPVLLDPYGGPAGQRVLAARPGFRLSQWFADQGFAVVVADGRGTPGRGPAWDRTIHLDKAEPALTDQITALHAAAERFPDLDLSRVAIRGWSYGGFLAALAVLRRPDVFHAASAGAAPTDAHLYSTYYQERYLGHPDEQPDAYRDASLLDDAPKLGRPLLLIHGLVDDNVHPAHVFKLSAALQKAGRDHTVLAIPETSHAPLDPD
ncbi:MAG: prolyl oligopeptidase family serine peptidase, partial [Stackebrandtia sp.]